ncbi:MAG: hypothetical protein A2007_05405 [Verrucomicrobia bacterium GWC2_42_7]|nr:MAG: hypothetical protein A2007_05405 [Verrucomicrobia bacterium GWC2_42_7]
MEPTKKQYPCQQEVTPKTVGVIDVGSNTIKILVAKKGIDDLEVVFTKAIENRIGEGICKKPYFLSEKKMQEAADAIGTLIEAVENYTVSTIEIVATSAVRDAANGSTFASMVHKKFGIFLKILSGKEEAEGIARGILTDPLCSALKDFSIVDIGGGSAEFIKVEGGIFTQTTSLPLGAVRLTEQFIKNYKEPIHQCNLDAIYEHVTNVIPTHSPFIVKKSPLVATGGTIATLKSILQERGNVGKFLEKSDIQSILASLIQLTSKERAFRFSITENRADIFPTGLITIIAIMDVLSTSRILFSKRNLRFGLAASLL